MLKKKRQKCSLKLDKFDSRQSMYSSLKAACEINEEGSSLKGVYLMLATMSQAIPIWSLPLCYEVLAVWSCCVWTFLRTGTFLKIYQLSLLWKSYISLIFPKLCTLLHLSGWKATQLQTTKIRLISEHSTAVISIWSIKRASCLLAHLSAEVLFSDIFSLTLLSQQNGCYTKSSHGRL